MYYKFIGNNRFGYKYNLGLNVLPRDEKFSDKPYGGGGLHCTTAADIYYCTIYGDSLACITIPKAARSIKLLNGTTKADRLNVVDILDMADINVVNRLIDEGAPASDAFIYAAEKGHLQVIQSLKIDLDNTSVYTSLIRACSGGHCDVFTYIMTKYEKRQLDISIILDHLTTCFDRNIMEYVLSEYPPSDRQILNMVKTSIYNNSLAALKYLEETFGQIQLDELTLTRAIVRSNLSTIRYIINADYFSSARIQAFNKAIERGYLNVLEILVDKYSIPDIAAMRLHANRYNQFEIIQYLNSV